MKTTLVTSLAYALGSRGKKVLVIDFDPQANASENIGFDINSEWVCFGHLVEDYAMYGKLCRPDEIIELIEQPEYVMNTHEKGIFGLVEKPFPYPFYALPISRASKVMIRLENCLVPQTSYAHRNSEQVAFYLLKPFIKMLREHTDFDYILIDTNPSLSLLSMNAIIASDYLVMPCYLGNEGVAGASAVYDIIEEVKLNAPDFINLGIVIQKYNPRRKLDRFLCEELEHTGIPLFETRIPDAFNRVNDATARGRLINQTDKNMAAVYDALAAEIIEKTDRMEAAKEKGKTL